MVRVRQLIDEFTHRIQFVPILGMVTAIVLSQATLAVDRQLAASDLPRIVTTTVDGGRVILSSIAGGLIASVVLLLSMMLVAVQLASSQFSPRTVRNLIGDRSLQVAIGLVLGAAVFCLLVLRETRALEEGEELIPHLSVVVGVLFGLGSLVAVVRSVDRVTNRLRVGIVARELLDQTVSIIEETSGTPPLHSPRLAPAQRPTEGEQTVEPPEQAIAIESDQTGWIQQVDTHAVLEAIPEGSTVYLVVPVGAFVQRSTPLAWVWPGPIPDETPVDVRRCVAVGDSRTMQEDVGFGILQMVDIALRALSPGVNDPNTAADLVVHLGAVMMEIWERPEAASRLSKGGRTLITNQLNHAAYLRAAFDPIRRHGASEPLAMEAMIRTLTALLAEIERRNLPGPAEPILAVLEETADAIEASSLANTDKRSVLALLPDR